MERGVSIERTLLLGFERFARDTATYRDLEGAIGLPKKIWEQALSGWEIRDSRFTSIVGLRVAYSGGIRLLSKPWHRLWRWP